MPDNRLRRFVLCLFLIFPASASYAQTLSEEWMEVRMLGSKIGFSYQKVEKTEDGYKLNSKSVMKLQMGDVTQDISYSQTYFLDNEMKPKRFSYIQKMLNHRQFFDGVVKGNRLNITIRSGGSVTEKTIPFENDTYLGDAINILLGKRKLKTGDEFSFKIFIVPLLSNGTIKIKVGKTIPYRYMGKEEDTFIVTSVYESFSVTSYITKDGRTLKEESPMGFTTLAVDKEKALSFEEGIMPFTNLLTFSLIPIAKPIEEQEKINKISLTISGLSKADALPKSERQKIVKTEERLKDGKAAYSVKLEMKKKDKMSIKPLSRPLPAVGMEKHLRPTFEAQSNDPAIIKQAKKIVGDEPDAFKSASLINSWVYKNVEKKFVDTFSAVETLRTLEGECQSHTNLFTALARSAGIPTRTVSGIVYSKDFNGFLYHAWPEVFVGEWVAMDPTLGQKIADPTHIKLIDGDLSKQIQLFEFLGKIDIDVESITRDR